MLDKTWIQITSKIALLAYGWAISALHSYDVGSEGLD